MEVPCEKCGFKSPMGAVFCRNCGEKLDIDNIRPDNIAAGAAKKSAKAVGAVIKKVVLTAALIFTLVLIVAFFLSNGDQPAEGGIEKTAIRKSEKLFNTFYKVEDAPKAKRVHFDSLAEFTQTVQHELNKKIATVEEITLGLIPRHINVTHIEGNDFRFTFVSSLRLKYGQRPLYTVIEATLVPQENANSFTVNSVSQGKIPVPSALQEPLLSHIEKVFLPDNYTLTMLLGQLGTIELGEDKSLSLNFKKKKKEKKS